MPALGHREMVTSQAYLGSVCVMAGCCFDVFASDTAARWQQHCSHRIVEGDVDDCCLPGLLVCMRQMAPVAADCERACWPKGLLHRFDVEAFLPDVSAAVPPEYLAMYYLLD